VCISGSFSTFDTVTKRSTSVAGVWRVCYFVVTSLDTGSLLMSERDQFTRQIERLASSSALHGSESLCKLLRYLAKHALDHSGTPVKEYQIATEVFGRPANFDPQSDSAIRVQAGRLRGKLTEYYGSEGADDPILVELPKGTYLLQFHHRAVNREGSNGHGRQELARPGLQKWMMTSIVLGILLAISVFVIAGMMSSNRVTPTALAGEAEPVPPEFRQLWKRFLSGPREPWVIFSNAAFVGRPETGMRYYNSEHDSKGEIWDHYTGVGEVLAVHSLDQVFSTLHYQIRVKRGSLFSLDDVKNNNLIFLGSPSENLTLMEIPSTHEFVFQRATQGPRKGDLGIVNVHPQGAEPRIFMASPSTSPLTEDYAVIGFLPGLDPSRSVMIFAGTTTFGTQAAAEYVCRQDSLHELLSRLHLNRNGEVPPFEAVLEVKVTLGVPVQSHLLAVRQP